MNEPYSQNLASPPRSVSSESFRSSKSKSSSGSSNTSRKELVKAALTWKKAREIKNTREKIQTTIT